MRNLFCSGRARLAVILAGACFGCSSSSPAFLSSADQPSAATVAAADQAESSQPAEASSPAEGSAVTSPTGARAVSYAEPETVSTGDVIRWTSCGVREDVILERIERSLSVFRLTAADENHLRDKGVSETVIQEMNATARR